MTLQPGVAFLSNYEYTDVMLIKLNGKSTAVWGISPPSREDLLNTLLGPEKIDLTFTVEFIRYAVQCFIISLKAKKTEKQ